MPGHGILAAGQAARAAVQVDGLLARRARPSSTASTAPAVP